MTEKNNKITIIALSLVIVGLLAAVVFIKNAAGDELSPEIVAEKMINYINDNNLLEPGAKASLVEVSDEGSVYKVRLSVDDMEFDSFASKDGIFLFPQGYDSRESLVAEEPQAEPSQDLPDLSDIDAKELAEFVGCLKDAGFVIYGADWCGWTKKLVEMFGGWEIVSSVYVECTEQAELCQQKDVTGYPTILINDKAYQGNRSFEGFSEVTGCFAPASSESQDTSSPAGGC
jgi:hypothetical protein